MNNKKKLLGGSLIVILVTFVVVALVFTLQTFGQEVSNDTYPTGAGSKTELSGGSWVMTGMEQHSYNSKNITQWNTSSGEISGLCSWKDMLDIVHTVNSGFKWDDPPKTMQPGAFLNIEGKYINNEYSTPCKVVTGIKMFIDKRNANFLANNADAVEIMKLSKDNKVNTTEIKKGFFTAPKTLFDETNQCELVVDCFVGQDHYVTTYTYTYQP